MQRRVDRLEPRHKLEGSIKRGFPGLRSYPIIADTSFTRKLELCTEAFVDSVRRGSIRYRLFEKFAHPLLRFSATLIAEAALPMFVIRHAPHPASTVSGAVKPSAGSFPAIERSREAPCVSASATLSLSRVTTI